MNRARGIQLGPDRVATIFTRFKTSCIDPLAPAYALGAGGTTRETLIGIPNAAFASGLRWR